MSFVIFQKIKKLVGWLTDVGFVLLYSIKDLLDLDLLFLSWKVVLVLVLLWLVVYSRVFPCFDLLRLLWEGALVNILPVTFFQHKLLVLVAFVVQCHYTLIWMLNFSSFLINTLFNIQSVERGWLHEILRIVL